MDEGSIFPEYGQPRLDRLGSMPPTGSCESPDYDLAQSIDAEIPSAGDWLRGLKRPDIAVPRDPKVARYIRYFASAPRGRETFASWLRRSGAYRDVVTNATNRLSLPIDLMAVMFVESGCWPSATSSAGAAGLWQFMPQTARAYGLTVQGSYDERRSIWRSTEAALAHLSDLHSQFESWHLALAAYNLGYQQLSSRLHSTRTEDFFTLAKIPDALPRETALYVPKVLAVAVILRNLEYFGFDGVEKLSPMSASRIEVPANTRLSLLARASGTSTRKLKELNPQILGNTVPDTGSPVYVYLPNRGLARAKAMLPRLLDEDGRQSIDLNVASDFDWGREEFDSNWRSRLERTKPGYAESESHDGDRMSTEPRRDAPAKDSTEERHDRPIERNAERPLRGRSYPDDREGASRLEKLSISRSPENRSSATSPSESGRSSSANNSSRTSSNPPAPPRERKEELAYRGERQKRRGQETSTYYRIKPGDTLSELAESFKISSQQLAVSNGISDPSHILAGARLRVAADTPRGRRN